MTIYLYSLSAKLFQTIVCDIWALSGPLGGLLRAFCDCRTRIIALVSECFWECQGLTGVRNLHFRCDSQVLLVLPALDGEKNLHCRCDP